MELNLLNRTSPQPQPGLKAERGNAPGIVEKEGDFAQALDLAGAVADEATGTMTSPAPDDAIGEKGATADGVASKAAPNPENAAGVRLDARLKKKAANLEGSPEAALAQAMLANAASTSSSASDPALVKASAEKGLGSGDPKASSLQGKPGEKPGVTLKQVANLRNIDAFTGSRPWDSQWVFQAGDKQNPELRGLFDSPQSPAQDMGSVMARLAQAAALAGGAGEATARASGKAGADTLAQAQSSLHAQMPGSVAGAITGQGAGPQTIASLMQQMQGLSGEIDGVEAAMGGAGAKGAAKKPAKPALAAQAGISGGDFLDALSQVKDGKTAKTASFGAGAAQAPSSALFGRIGETKPGLSGKSGSGNLEEGSRGFSGSTAEVAAALGGARPANLGEVQPSAFSLTGQVTQNGQARNRLSNESLTELGQRISSFSVSGQGMAAGAGGGEIRIRLNPDNMGELHLKVVTKGNQVGLQIQASDEKARKVIEESLGSLKESLGAQNLTLAKFDVTIAQPTHGAHQASGDASQNPMNHDGRSQAGFDMSQGRSSGQDSRGGSASDEPGSGTVSRSGSASARSRMIAGANEAARAARASDAGRVDVMA